MLAELALIKPAEDGQLGAALPLPLCLLPCPFLLGDLLLGDEEIPIQGEGVFMRITQHTFSIKCMQSMHIQSDEIRVIRMR